MSIQSYLLEQIEKDLVDSEEKLRVVNLQMTDIQKQFDELSVKIKELKAVKKALASVKE